MAATLPPHSPLASWSRVVTTSVGQVTYAGQTSSMTLSPTAAGAARPRVLSNDSNLSVGVYPASSPTASSTFAPTMKVVSSGYIAPGERSVERSKPPALSFHIDSGTASPAPSSEGHGYGTYDPDGNCNYPASPINVLPMKAKIIGSEPRIGIDIGGVLTRDGDPDAAFMASQWGVDWEAPDALESVARIAQVFGPDNVFLVSKVKPGGSMQRRTEEWLHETMKFCPRTKVPRANIIFCSEPNGPEGKGVVAARLGFSHFVDDKIICLESVFHDSAGNSGHLIERFQGILFHFAKGGAGGPPECDLSAVAPMMRRYYQNCASWREVLQQLHQKLPGPLRQKGAPLVAPMEKSTVTAATYVPPPWARKAQPVQAQAPSSPTASRVLSAQPALQRTAAGGRPKLMLKPRTEAPAPPVEEVAPPPPPPPIVVVPRAKAMPVFTENPAKPKAMPVFTENPAKPMAMPVFTENPAKPKAMPVFTENPLKPKLVLKARAEPPAAIQVVEEEEPITWSAAAARPAVQQGMCSPSGRPKLMLKRRDSKIGAVGTEAVVYQAVEPLPQRQVSPQALLVEPLPQRQVSPPPRMIAAPAVVVPAGPGAPALQPDPSGGRPRLLLKKRQEQPVEAPPVMAMPNPSPRGCTVTQVRILASPKNGPAPAPVFPVPALQTVLMSPKNGPAPDPVVPVPALQKDPAGGRPRLVLKPKGASQR